MNTCLLSLVKHFGEFIRFVFVPDGSHEVVTAWPEDAPRGLLAKLCAWKGVPTRFERAEARQSALLEELAQARAMSSRERERSCTHYCVKRVLHIVLFESGIRSHLRDSGLYDGALGRRS